MTVKTESDHQGRPYVPGTGQSVTREVGPEVTAESTESAAEPDIPFATAVFLNDAPPTQSAYNPSFVGPTVTSATAETTTTTPAASATDPGASASTQPAYQTFGANQPVLVGDRPPPPGLPPGGRWVKMRHIGNGTWLACGIISAVFCVFMCMPCGLWAFLCPCDEREVYLANGKLFNQDGGVIGSARSRNYR